MFPNKKESILLTLAWIAVQFLIGICLSIYGVNLESGSPTIYIIVAIVSASVIIAFSLKKMGLNFFQLFHANFNRPFELLILVSMPVIFIVIGFQVLISNYFNVYYSIFPQPTSISQGIETLMGNGIFGFISICLVAPIVEEVIFRGIILRGLMSHYSTNQAIFLSSVLFSLIHINPDQLLSALLIGCFFGWLYVRSYSLWPSILAHISFNVFVFMLSNSDIKLYGVNYFPDDVIVYPSLTLQLASFFMIYASIYYLNKMLNYGEASNK